MKKLYQQLCIVLVFVFLAAACSREEANLFSETSAVRMEKTKTDIKNILCNAQNGWVMEYFPTDTTEGYTFLMKFDHTSKVMMAAQNKWIGNQYTTDSCVFDVIADDGPVLTFPVSGNYVVNGTQVGIFQMFANPEDPRGGNALDGYGFQGDYEFIVMKADSNLITLSGKKRGTSIVLKKLPANQSWTGYIAQVEAMRSLLFENNHTNLTLKSGSDSLILINDLISYGSYANKFRIYPYNSNELINGVDYAFIVTPKGIRFHTPYVSNGKSAQNFELTPDKQKLLCTDENVNAHINGANPIDFYLSQMSTKKWVLNLSDAAMSPTVKAIIDRIKASMLSNNLTLNQINLRYYSARSSYVVNIVYQSGSSPTLTNAYWDYNISVVNSSKLKYTFKKTYDSDGSILYTNFDGFADLASLISNTFSLTADCGINPNNLKLTNISNQNSWFKIQKQ
jgi:hypothetical protein